MAQYRYYFERVGQAVLTYVVVATLSFVMIRWLPGGPMAYLKAQLIESGTNMNPEQMNNIIETYINVRPSEPLLQQYISYMSGVLQLDFGKSMWFGEPVGQILINALPWTMFLMSMALFLTFTIGVSFGAILAYNEGTTFDYFGTLAGFLFSSVPYYVAAIIIVVIFGYQLGWFPTGGRVNYSLEASIFNPAFVISAFYHAVLPVFSLVITRFGMKAISMRANSVRVLGSDYLRVARLRGLPSRRISLRYVARNAILPLYTTQLIAIGALFGGSVILEMIFQYPGVGYYLFRGVQTRDYPLMMGGLLMITAAILIGILIADLTYGLVDPRAKGGTSRESY